MMNGSTRHLLIVAFATTVTTPALAQIAPGTGTRVSEVGDNFEDSKWTFHPNGNKSSQENDGRIRSPLGRSRNGRWQEGHKRGYPDRVERVATPPGGLPGSQGALLLQSCHTGIPGRITRQMQQDDFMASNFEVSVQSSPSYVVRVFLPPFDQWEDRDGSTFGFRAGARAQTKDEIVTKKYGRRTYRNVELVTMDAPEPYWPGMFIQFHSSHDGDRKKDMAMLVCRSGRTGNEFQGIEMQPGWYTLGLSFTPEGRVHYYASPGVDRLTEADRLGSSYPYNLHCDSVTTMFFNICSPDDGKTWSTAWIIDDPEMYVGAGRVIAAEPRGGLFGGGSANSGGGFFDKLFR